MRSSSSLLLDQYHFPSSELSGLAYTKFHGHLPAAVHSSSSTVTWANSVHDDQKLYLESSYCQGMDEELHPNCKDPTFYWKR